MKSKSHRIEKPAPSILVRLLLAILVIGCIIVAWRLPLWQMKLVAPMYPNGLKMIAYGDKITGDLYELNILNQYVGMKHIDPNEFSVMWLFPFGLAVVAALGAIPIFVPRLRKFCAIGIFLFPLTILGFIQYYLYGFGHNLDPSAPFKVKEFMPFVLGKSTIVNFTSTAIISWGIGALLLASLITGFGPFIFHKRQNALKIAPIRQSGFKPVNPITTTGLFIIFLLFSSSTFSQNILQQRIDAAPSGGSVHIQKGIYNGPIHIDKPITLIGVGMPEIRGDRKTDVVSIKSDNVTFSGFKVCYSGVEITQEASGIRVQGNNILLSDNEVRNVYFGIHILGSDKVTILRNTIVPSQEYAGRPGHAINAWNVSTLTITENSIDDARDGILLTYAKDVSVTGNTITHCRYGLHSMYGLNITFSANTVRDNLLGLALMYSKVLYAHDNKIIEQRRGTSPYGFLLKDIDNVTIEHNLIEANQIGIFADGISMELGSASKINDNFIVGNICGVSVQSSATFTFVGNSVLENLTDVQKQGEHINAKVNWTEAGKGNYWSNYRGYDKNGDRLGELSYRVEQISELDVDPHSSSQALLYTPGYLVLESAIRLFPIFKGDPVLEDNHPLLDAPTVVMAAGLGDGHSYSFTMVSTLILIGGVVSIASFKPFNRSLI